MAGSYDPNHREVAKFLRGEQVRAMVHRHAEEVAARVRGIAPRDTGRLAASIHVEDGHSLSGDRVAALVVADTGYAASVEYGTLHSRGQHYLRRAL